jgi:hypothetical protein
MLFDCFPISRLGQKAERLLIGVREGADNREELEKRLGVVFGVVGKTPRARRGTGFLEHRIKTW